MFNLKEAKIMADYSNQANNQMYVSKTKQYETPLVFYFVLKRQSF